MNNKKLNLDYWKTMREDRRVGFLLAISEVILKSLETNEYYSEIRKSLDICWEWAKTREITGDEIYYLLDDGTEFGGLFIIMQMDTNIENEPKWDCIIDCISYVARIAFLDKNEAYLPEPIENIDEEIIIHFLECYNILNIKQVKIEKILEYLSETDVPTKEEIKDWLGL